MRLTPWHALVTCGSLAVLLGTAGITYLFGPAISVSSNASSEPNLVEAASRSALANPSLPFDGGALSAGADERPMIGIFSGSPGIAASLAADPVSDNLLDLDFEQAVEAPEHSGVPAAAEVLGAAANATADGAMMVASGSGFPSPLPSAGLFEPETVSPPAGALQMLPALAGALPTTIDPADPSVSETAPIPGGLASAATNEPVQPAVLASASSGPERFTAAAVPGNALLVSSGETAAPIGAAGSAPLPPATSFEIAAMIASNNPAIALFFDANLPAQSGIPEPTGPHRHRNPILDNPGMGAVSSNALLDPPASGGGGGGGGGYYFIADNVSPNEPLQAVGNNGDPTADPVSEPDSLAMLGPGIGIFLWARYRQSALRKAVLPA